MNKICTDISQSKKLIELGIDVNTADMFWTYDFTVNDINGINVISNNFKPEKDDIHAWSLSALLGLMPFHIIENDVRYGFQMVKGLNKEGETYKIRYEGYISLVETLIYNNPIDAAFETVCWLKENGKL